ncbi:MAG TPA: SDR family NAD(P)-dependent oxidoreductase [Puia sp.]|nr:SDR family NAD(P)-dependent oxidoreductase [Puia sp.]
MDIAIIGMAGRFPGAVNIETFRQHLRKGTDNIRPPSAERKRNTCLSEDIEYQAGGFMEDIELFDYRFFNISLHEAEYMDPRQRLLLEIVHEAFDDAACDMGNFDGTRTSVFVGDTRSDYRELAKEPDPTLLTGSMNAAIAGKIARFFRLRGSAQMIDTSCSSSLVALHFACMELSLGHSDQALVCGVNLVLTPEPIGLDTGANTGISITSPDGKTRSFSDQANGTGAGEAVICIILKPLEKAVAAGDIIHAIIKGSAVNQDADLSASLTAPSPQAQAAVISKAWNNARIDPETITYIEAHGTATRLGDPIEIQGIQTAFQPFTSKKGFCAISAVKSNIGHTDSASGLAGLVKAILSLKNRELFPSLHFERPNPFISLENSPVYINPVLKEWLVPPGQVRRAGVSAFGLSGTNCHVVLEEAPARADEQQDQPTESSYLFTLSARSESSLQKRIRALREYLLLYPGLAAKDISYTLNSGRTHYNHRFAVIADSTTSFLQNLIYKRQQKHQRIQGKIKVLFTLSRQIEDAGSLCRSFGEKFPAFRSDLTRCEEAVPHDKRNDSFYTVAFQYCFYKLLEQYGVNTLQLAGDGPGKTTIDILTGKRSLSDGLLSTVSDGKADNLQKDGHVDIHERCRLLVQKMDKEPVIFAELGPAGNISSGLADIYTTVSNYELLVLNRVDPGPFLGYIKNLYLAGYPVNPLLFHKERSGIKITLPGYEFDSDRCWLTKPPESVFEDWCYDIDWIMDKDEPPGNPDRSAMGLYVIFSDRYGLASELVRQLEAQDTICIRVTMADQFRRLTPYQYTIDGSSESDYERLQQEIVRYHKQVDGIIHLGGITSPEILTSWQLEAELDQGFLSQLYAANHFMAGLDKKGGLFMTVTANTEKVTEDDRLIAPAGSMTTALMKGLFADLPVRNILSLDFDLTRDSPVSIAGAIIHELNHRPVTRFAAYRKGCRYSPNLQLHDSKPENENSFLKKIDGIYLITGGSAGIGFEIARSMIKKAPCHLILTGRTELPPRRQWIDALRNSDSADLRGRIKNLLELEELGASVLYFQADVADRSAMSHLFDELGQRFDKIHGIIHSAGIGISGIPLKEKKTTDVLAVLRPKVNGTLLLEEYSRKFNPDIFVLFSSLNAVIPQKNSADYAAANAFQNAFARYQRGQGRRFISIGWPGWTGTGMSMRKTSSPSAMPAGGFGTINITEGLRLFYHCIRLPTPEMTIARIDWSKYGNNPFFDVNRRNTGAASIATGKKELPPEEGRLWAEGWSKTETQLLRTWLLVLKSEKIGAEDSFFDVGGHSLIAIQLINQIKETFGVSIEFEDIFEYDTIRAMARHLDAMITGRTVPGKPGQEISPEAAGIPLVHAADHYELSAAQRRLWVACQFMDDKAAYNLPLAWLIEGTLDLAALEYSFQALIQRHESLRTSFRLQEGEVRQHIEKFDPSRYKIIYNDCRSSEEPKVNAAVLLDADSRQGFELQQGGLIRASLYHIANQEFLFLLNMHHIVSDTWSTKILLSGIMEAYEAHRAGKQPSTQNLKIQYKDFAAWQNSRLRTPLLEQLRQYWLPQFGEVIAGIRLPLDKPAVPMAENEGDSLSFTGSREEYNALAELARESDSSIFMIVFAAIALLLYRYTGNTQIILPSPVSGRVHKDLEDQIGFYLNLLPFSISLQGTETFSEVIKKSRKAILEGLEHQEYPFDLLTNDLKAKYKRDIHLLESVAFTWHGKDRTTAGEGAGFIIRPQKIKFRPVQTLLWFHGYDHIDSLSISLEYSKSSFVPATIRLMAERLQTIIRQLIRQPSLRFSDLPLQDDSTGVPQKQITIDLKLD